MKFKKLFSLSTLCVVGALGVGLLGACDNEDNDTEGDTCTGEECSTDSSESPAERTYVSQSLYTFSGTINLGLGTTVTGVIGNGSYYGDVDIPTTLTIGTYGDEHYTIWLDCEIPIESVSLSFIEVKLTGYGGNVLDPVDTSHLSLYYDSEEDNVYYHRIDKGVGTNINTYEVFGSFETSEYLKNPLYYVTKDMFGCGQRIFDGIGDIVSENPLDVDSLLTSIPELVTSSEITSGINVIGDEYTLSLDGGAPTDTTSAIGEVEASVSVYDDHSKDSIYAYIPTYFTVSLLGTDYNLEFDITMDLALDTSAPKEVSSDSFSEIEGFISENESNFVTNYVTEVSSNVAEPVTVTERTYESVTTYSGTITLSLTNIGVYTTENEENVYTYTGKAEIETTLIVGTYTDDDGDTQTSYLLDCDIPIVTVQFASSTISTIKLTGYGNGVLSNSVSTSHLTAYYDTSDDVICWHRIDTGSNSALNKTLDTYENFGAYTQEAFSENPLLYINRDFFGCGARIYGEAVDALDTDAISNAIGEGLFGEDGISASLTSDFTYSSQSLEFGLVVSLTEDDESGQTADESAISEFVSYIGENSDYFLTNSIIEVSYLSSDSDEAN
ncbi:MAG: hypothetical protein LUB56_00915 [Coprobacillus sp.]|nr:hypothetical protein [Coprobacillus sp.]